MNIYRISEGFTHVIWRGDEEVVHEVFKYYCKKEEMIKDLEAIKADYERWAKKSEDPGELWDMYDATEALIEEINAREGANGTIELNDYDLRQIGTNMEYITINNLEEVI